MAQAREVWRALTLAHPDRRVEIVTADAVGDRDTETPIAELGVQGAFTGELERALLAGQVDVAGVLVLLIVLHPDSRH